MGNVEIDYSPAAPGTKRIDVERREAVAAPGVSQRAANEIVEGAVQRAVRMLETHPLAWVKPPQLAEALGKKAAFDLVHRLLMNGMGVR